MGNHNFIRLDRPLFFLGFFFFGLLFSPPLANAVDEKLLSDLKTYVAEESPKLGSGLQVGFLVESIDTDETFFAESEQDLLVPASLQKLLLSLTALRVLGGQYHFPTEIFLDHLPRAVDPEGKERVDFQTPITSVGNLYVRGYGDPSMDSMRMMDMALAIRQYGVEKVQDVILDDSLLLAPAKASGPRPSEAGSNAFSINQNAFAVYVAANRAASPAFVSLSPGLNFEVVNQVLTMRGREQSIAIETQPKKLVLPAEGESGMLGPSARVIVRGSFGQEIGGMVLWQSLPDISRAYADILLMSMKKAGIEVKGKLRFAEVPQNAVLLETFQSKSLSEILRDMNQQSSNVIASQLLYALGQDEKGYFRSELGVKRLNAQLDALSSPKPKVPQVVDGSGFDRRNRLSARQIANVLKDAAKDFSISPDFVASLGKFSETGTLKTRSILNEKVLKALRGDELRKGKLRARSVWAKTGTLEGVSGLAGYAVTKNDARVVFVLIENNVKDKQSASDFEDGFLRTLLGLQGQVSDVEEPVSVGESGISPKF